MKTLHYRHSDVGHIELFVQDEAAAEIRQVASLIPRHSPVEPRHEALAEFICRCPKCLLSCATLAALAEQFELHPIFVVRESGHWDASVWCPIEEVLHANPN